MAARRRREKARPDRRVRRSTARMLAYAGVLTAFAFMISFVWAWGMKMDRIAAVSSTDVFKSMDLEAIDGRRFSSANLKDAKITMVNVWETTCYPCITEMPDLEKLSNEYSDGEMQVVGLVNDVADEKGNVLSDRLEDAKKMVERTGVTYPCLICDAKTHGFMEATIVGTPTTFFIDSEGTMVEMVTGANDYTVWKQRVDEILSNLDQQT